MNHETEIAFPTPPTTYAASGLTVLSAAARAVSEDVRCFLHLAFDQKEDDSSRRFVVSAVYYGRVLIQQTFTSFYNITPVPAGLTDRLERTRVELVNMDARLCELEASIPHWILSWPQLQAGDLVPTAGPYQLLHQLMLERIEVATTLATVGEKTMMRLLRKRALFALPDAVRQSGSPPDPDGRPTMVFVSLYQFDDTSSPCLLLGANETNWGCLTGVSTVTKTARDVRLADYIPIAWPAYNKLRESDEERRAALKPEAVTQLLWDARRQAANDLRGDEAFLGGTNEMGLAFRPLSWSANKPCFLCFSMMGYRDVMGWSTKDQDKYMALFD